MQRGAGPSSPVVRGGAVVLERVRDGDGAPWESAVDDAICSAAVTPDNTLLAVGSEGGEILLRELGSAGSGGGQERRLAGHAGGTMALSWVTPPAAAVAGRAGWEKQAHRSYVQGAGASASAAARYAALCATYGVASPAQSQPFGGWVLVSSGADGHVRAWDGATGRLLCAQPCKLDGKSSSGGVSGSAGAWVMNVDTMPITIDGMAAIRYLATVGKHVLTGVLVPEAAEAEAEAAAAEENKGAATTLAGRAADAEALGPLDKTVDCASFCSDGSVAACCYGGVAVWRPRNDPSAVNDCAAPRKFSYKGWLVRLAPSPGTCLCTMHPAACTRQICAQSYLYYERLYRLASKLSSVHVLCCAVLCCAVLCCAVLCCAVLC
jgi:hypothetical protein